MIHSENPLATQAEADHWLNQLDDSDRTGELLDDAIETLDRARAADASASGTPFGTPTSIRGVLAARIGYGDGDQVASGRFLDAVDVDARGGTGSGRRERNARTGSSARTAAILGGREQPSACEALVPRLRLDLSTGNETAAFVAASGAIAATVSELEFAVEGEDHERDLDELEQLLPTLDEISHRAREGGREAADLERVEAALTIAERVLRRRRILDQ